MDNKERNRNDDYDFSDLLQEESCDYITEENFYSPSDNRQLTSYIEDIEGGDNFEEYCKYIFELLEEEGYYD